jgi:hypothetical protein
MFEWLHGRHIGTLEQTFTSQEFFMQTVQLDSKKLLGYRIAFDGKLLGVKAGYKKGRKVKSPAISLGAKLGNKIGGKAGRKQV